MPEGYLFYYIARMAHQVRGFFDSTAALTVNSLSLAGKISASVLTSPWYILIFPIFKIITISFFLGAALRRAYLNEKHNPGKGKYFWNRYPQTTKVAKLLTVLGTLFIVGIIVALFNPLAAIAILIIAIGVDTQIERMGIQGKKEINATMRLERDDLFEELCDELDLDRDYANLADLHNEIASIEDKDKQSELATKLELINANDKVIKLNNRFIKVQQRYYIVGSNITAAIGLVLFAAALAFPPAAVALTAVALSVLFVSSVISVFHTQMRMKAEVAIDGAEKERDMIKSKLETLNEYTRDSQQSDELTASPEPEATLENAAEQNHDNSKAASTPKPKDSCKGLRSQGMFKPSKDTKPVSPPLSPSDQDDDEDTEEQSSRYDV